MTDRNHLILVLLTILMWISDARHQDGLFQAVPAFAPALTPTGRHRHLRQTVVPHAPSKRASIRLHGFTNALAEQAVETIVNPWSQENIERCRKLWNLTPDETVQLQVLGNKLADVKHVKNNPFELARFLKEYKHKPQQVIEEKFRAMIQWRRENNVDNLLEDYCPPSLYRYFPAGVILGRDKEGDPIHIERTGVADSSGLLQRYGREEMIKQAIWLREVQSRGTWHKDYESAQKRPVTQFTVIMDMKDLKARNISPSLLAVGHQVSKIVQSYYPGYTKRIIVIRAPPIFQIAFNALKPFIDEDMKDRIVIAGGENYCKVLEQYTDLRVLPREVCDMGQGAAVPDFQNVVWQGGKIPSHEETDNHAPPAAHHLRQVAAKPEFAVNFI